MLNLYEKYKVKSFEEFDEDIKVRYGNIINIFKSLNKENLPNILLYGESGSAKRTLLYSFFNNIKKQKYICTYKTSSKPIEYIIYKSNEYIELDLNDLGIYKKYILKDIIKDFIQTRRVFDNKNKIIIIHNIHLLNVDDQFILRKIIEEYIINCRFILLSNTINNLLEPIKSRCLILKTPGFNKEILHNKINDILKKEDIELKQRIINEIVLNSKCNLKRAILELDTYLNMKKVDLESEKNYFKMKSESVENIILRLIKSFRNKEIKYEDVDEILYKLLINYKIEATIIIQYIYDNIYAKLNDKKKYQVVNLNYEYNKNLMNASKKIIYLQSYIYNLHEILQSKK